MFVVDNSTLLTHVAAYSRVVNCWCCRSVQTSGLCSVCYKGELSVTFGFNCIFICIL